MFNFFKKKRNKARDKKIEQYEYIKNSFIEFFVYEKYKDREDFYDNRIKRHKSNYRLIYDKKGELIKLDYSPRGFNSNVNEKTYYQPSSSHYDKSEPYAIFTKDFKTLHPSEAYKRMDERFGKYY